MSWQDNILNLPCGIKTTYGAGFFRRVRDRLGIDSDFMSIEDAVQTCAELGLTNTNMIGACRKDPDFIKKYYNMPGDPVATYKYKEFFKDVKKLMGLWTETLSESETRKICLEHKITSRQRYDTLRKGWKKEGKHLGLHYYPTKEFDIPDYFGDIRKELGLAKEFLGKREAFALCVKDIITSEKTLRDRRRRGIPYKMLPTSPNDYYKDKTFFKRIRAKLKKPSRGEVRFIKKAEALKICIKERATNKTFVSRIKPSYPKLPSDPCKYYNDPDFFVKVRKGLPARWMSKEKALAVCVKHEITSGHKLPKIRHLYKKMPGTPVDVYSDKKFFRTVRDRMGFTFNRDTEWLPKKVAIAAFIKEGITSELALGIRSADFFNKYPRIPKSPVRYYKDKRLFRKVRDALGVVYSKDQVWMPVEEAIKVCINLGVTNHNFVRKIKEQYPNIPINPTRSYKDPDFFKKVRAAS